MNDWQEFRFNKLAINNFNNDKYSTQQINEIYNKYISDNKDKINAEHKRHSKKKFRRNYKTKKKLSITNLDRKKRQTGITNFGSLPSLTHKSKSLNSSLTQREGNMNIQKSESKKIKKKPKTNVGFKLFTLNLSRVLLIAIFLLITIPMFTSETYFKMMTSYQSGLIALGELANFEKKISPDFDNLLKFYIDTFDKESGGNRKILYLKIMKVNKTLTKIEDFNDSNTETIKEYKKSEDVESRRPYVIKSFSSIIDYTNVPNGSFYLVVFVDNSYDENIDAVLGIFRTIFVLLVFAFLTYFFRRDTTKLLVQPMSKMKRTIKIVKKYPIRATTIIDFEFLFEYFEMQK